MAITINAKVKGTEFLEKWEKKGVKIKANLEGDLVPKTKDLSFALNNIRSSIASISSAISTVGSLANAMGLGDYSVHIRGLQGIATAIVGIATATSALQASLGAIALLGAGVAWVVNWAKSVKEETKDLKKNTDALPDFFESGRRGISPLDIKALENLTKQVNIFAEDFKRVKNLISQGVSVKDNTARLESMRKELTRLTNEAIRLKDSRALETLNELAGKKTTPVSSKTTIDRYNASKTADPDWLNMIQKVTDAVIVSITAIEKFSKGVRASMKAFESGGAMAKTNAVMNNILDGAAAIGDVMAQVPEPMTAAIGKAISAIAKASDGLWKWITGWWRGANDSWAKNVAKDIETQQKAIDDLQKKRQDAIRGLEKSISVFENAFNRGAISAGAYAKILLEGQKKRKQLEDININSLKDVGTDQIKKILGKLGGWNDEVAQVAREGERTRNKIADQIKEIINRLKDNKVGLSSPETPNPLMASPINYRTQNTPLNISINNNLVLNPDNPSSWDWLVQKIIDRIKLQSLYQSR